MTRTVPALKSRRAATRADDEACWRAVVARDTAQDGHFVFAVVTTGVYCRPSCGARRPKRENVRFFTAPATAEAAGFRPCKRCRPEESTSKSDANAALVAAACRAIENSETPPSLADLAEAAGLSPHHFHRLFKAEIGVTPKAYAEAHRRARLQRKLQEARSVTEAAFDAGYSSSARFYESARGMLGMSPRVYRAGAPDTTLTYALAPCALGLVLVAATGSGLAAILLGDEAEPLERELAARFSRAVLQRGDSAFAEWLAQVVAYVDDPRTGLNLPLDIRGTAFQQRVWAALRSIPPGATVSYAELARAVGAPGAVRAVASACAANALAVAIPCHRVVRSDGALSGYRWGVERKRALLDKEHAPPLAEGRMPPAGAKKR